MTKKVLKWFLWGFIGLSVILLALAVWGWHRAPETTIEEVVETVVVEKKVIETVEVEVPVEVIETVEVIKTVEIEKIVEVYVTPEPEVEQVEQVEVVGVCQLDKIGTWSEQASSDRYRIEVGGHGVQHFDYYPRKGVLAVSYIVGAILSPDVPAIWWGYGSIWEGDKPECQLFDWVADATAYAIARIDSGHSGLVVDLRNGDFEVVYNATGMSQSDIDSLLNVHREGMYEE